MTEGPVKAWLERDGRVLRLRLARPKANVVDADMIAALHDELTRHLDRSSLLAVLLDHEGPNFSYGASVQEHLPEHCEAMLREFHRLVMRLLECPVPVLAAVRGQCLGGGLELACCAHLIFAGEDARFAQPEIKLGVFAPAASCVLPERIGPARADDLLLSGRSIDAAQAASLGLVNTVASDAQAAALAYFDEHLSALSASSLRFAVRASRSDLCARVKAKLASVEQLYLHELMASHDAVEGLHAFIEKRAASWGDR